MSTTLTMGKLLRLQVSYSKLRAAAKGDDFNVTTHDFHILDTTWPDAGTTGLTHNYAQMETDFTTFWNSLVTNGIVGTGADIEQYRWYREDDGELPWGEPSRVTTPTAPNEGANICLPPQCAQTVTEITESRRHWGRFYIPGISRAILNTDGSMSSAAVAQIAAAAKTLYDSWNTRGVQCLVLGSVKSTYNLALLPGTSRLGAAFEKKLFGDTTQSRIYVGYPVTKVQVDDIIDVQRRRRFNSPLVRDTRTLA